MRLLLCSSGFTNTEIISACEDLVGKQRTKINFVILNEAIKAEQGDHRWFAEGLTEIIDNFGGVVELVDLQAHNLAYITERLETADVIFCFGGNTDYLTEVFLRTGFAEVLPQILKTKVWVGSSAGSCVLCHANTQKINQEIWQEETSVNDYLGLVPIIFMPHFHSDWFPNNTEQVVLEESKRQALPVYALSDQAALVVEGDQADQFTYKLIGQDYLVAQNAKITTQG